jgi:O-methyltransferase
MNINDFIQIVYPYTMTSVERIMSLFNSLEYIRTKDIKGDLVECGVWRGGNILGICEYLNHYKMIDRKVYAYDTFKGMTAPEDIDVDFEGNKASDILGRVMCEASLDEVKKNVSNTKFPTENISYIEGDVLESLNFEKNLPKLISLLRLDTDWYDSTKKELETLYPRLIENGVLIVDDYGHWRGSKKAVDEYFLNQNIKMEQIDYTGIKMIKNENCK